MRVDAVSMSDALEKMNNVIEVEMKLKMIDCPDYLIGHRFDRTVNLEQRCFVSEQEPEDILALLSEQLQKLGEVEMQWRFDIGEWLASYKFFGNKLDILFTLKAPGNSILMQDDPTVKDYGAVGTFILEEKK